MTKTIPTIKGKFINGSVAELAAEGPEFLHRLAQEHGEVVRFSLFGNSVLLITNPDHIREVLVTQYSNFPKGEFGEKIMRRFIGNGLVTVSGDEHKKQRKMAQPAFHHKRIQNYADTMVGYTTNMVDEWQAGEWRDISQDMYELTMYIVAKTLFDADRDDMAGEADRVGEAIHILQELANDDFSSPVQWADWIPTPKNRKRKEARGILHETIEQLIAARGINDDIEDKGDLLSMLLLAHAEAGEGIDNAQVRDELITMFVAGHETTSNALTWTWYLLSQHPEVETKLHAELDEVLAGRMPALTDLPQLPYTLQVFKEALRLYPPAWILNAREAKTDSMIDGYEVPQGTLIFIAPYVNHRLPQYFSDPYTFNPERFTPEFEKGLPRYAYMPFGGGPRVCIGNSFATMEAHLILATMAQRVQLKLLPAQEVELNALITMSSKYGMKMQVVEREEKGRLEDRNLGGEGGRTDIP